MSRTNVEYLFQVTGPIGDRAFGGPPLRGDELQPAFGDHLSLASVSTLNEPGKTARRDDAELTRSRLDSPSESSQDDADERPSESSSSVTSAGPSASNDANAGTDTSRTDAGEELESEADVPAAESTSSEIGDGEGEAETDDEDSGELEDATVAQVENSLTSPAISKIEASLEIATGVDARAAESKASSETANGEPSTEKSATGQIAAKQAGELALNGDELGIPSEIVTGAIAADDGQSETAALMTGKKARRASTPVATEDDAAPASRAAAEKRGKTAGGPDGTANPIQSAQAIQESTGSTKKNSQQDSPGESDATLDEPSRVSKTRSTSRARGEAEAITGKIAAAALANGAVTQTNGNAAGVEAADDASTAAKPVAAKGEGAVGVSGKHPSNTAAAKRSGRSDSADDAPRVDAARFVGRVAKAFHTANERGGTLQLRLSPPELGSLHLELSVKDGVMTAALETETAVARRVLLDHLPALRDRLAEQNIRVERFDVDVRRDGTEGQTDPRATRDQQQPQQGHREPRRQPATQQSGGVTPSPTSPIIQPLASTAGINLVA